MAMQRRTWKEVQQVGVRDSEGLFEQVLVID
jgi:hypothetical protein